MSKKKIHIFIFLALDPVKKTLVDLLFILISFSFYFWVQKKVTKTKCLLGAKKRKIRIFLFFALEAKSFKLI